MKLNIVTPYTQVTYDNISKITANGKEGSFTILPKHMDYTSILIPCILKYTKDNKESELAIDEGILIKSGDDVKVGVMNFIEANENESLRSAIKRYFYELNEDERKGREIMAQLEAAIIKTLVVKK